MKKNIVKIANLLIMIGNSFSTNGLLNGKMGMAIFLYHSSKITGDKAYHDIADQLIDEILEGLCSNMDLSFANGLSGIAFGINHLIEHEFIDADPNDLFIDFDDKIFPEFMRLSNSDLTKETPLFSYGLYLLERIKNQDVQPELEVLVTKSIEICKNTFERKIQLNDQSTLYINSVIYFLISLKKVGYSGNKINSLIENGLILLNESLAEIQNIDCDFYISGQLISSLDVSGLLKKDILDTLLQLLNTQTNKFEEKINISRLWQTMLYFPKCRFEIDKKDINIWIDERLDSILDYDPDILRQELLVMGLSVLKNK